ncbi:hypothetical protein FA10DRAFT_301203 [Acaromyces ingoldii]|uniref:Inhibitor I9 domain-containing protein n=1 Tax=Acaromyces ingoldii TaxID=215250 RepID=A0A316YL19_9BASI|nr:hypothetical protein FA10DRAFT_301203 [Acaromyces ingoldii]PWN89902.1 hypothetical protein FA10DRAFT_301203 [Acaromyces ingoldii]
MSGNKSYMIIFRNEAPQAEIDSKIREVENKGGKIGQKFESGILRGFAATMSDDEANQLKALTEGGSHPHIEYIEPDQTMKTM